MLRELVTGLAAIALLLAAMGVFGVVGYSVRSRQAELGVRLALGATAPRLTRDLLREMLPIIVIGIAAGLSLGGFAGRILQAVLYGVDPADPLSMLGAAGVMGTAALLATYVPLRRVRRIDPIEAIRRE